MSTVEVNADVRPLTHRLSEDCDDLLTRVASAPFAQRVVRGDVTRETYAALLAQLTFVHEKLDDAMVTIRDHHGEIARLVPDSRLFGTLARDDIEAMRPALSGDVVVEPAAPTAALLERIDEVTEFEPFKLLGVQFAREGMRNFNRYLAKKLRGVFGEPPGARDGYAFFDGYGIGQRPIWERFRRDMDKLVLSEPEKQSIVGGARLYLDSLAQISGAVAEHPADAGEPRPIPVSF